MNTPGPQYKHAELALAAYVQLGKGSTGALLTDALTNADFSENQAESFAQRWRVVDQYNHSNVWTFTDAMGQPQELVGSNGLSATVFEEVATGKRVLAIRGTDDLADVWTDFVDVTVLGSWERQAQYASLRSAVERWQADGTLGAHFTVTGHSLGGFLAGALLCDLPGSVDHAYLYNAPGVGGALGPALQRMVGRSIPSLPDPGRVSNVRAAAGISPIAGLGASWGPPLSIVVEDQHAPDVQDPPASRNHSQRVLTDSLAVYDLYTRVDAGLSAQTIGAILKAGSRGVAPTLESAVGALARVFLPSSDAVATADRDGLYAAIDRVGDAVASLQSLGETYSIRPMGLDAGGDAAAATTDVAIRYALAELSPIAVQGRSYDAHAARLALFDPATESGVLTEGWLADRARFLAWKVYANTRDTASVFGYTENQEKWSYRDLARPDEGLTVLPAGLPSPQGAPEHLVVFGSDTADAAIVGGARSDRLYGMGGADTLSGGAGADYLEGNAGGDRIDGGAGNDELVGGADDDVLHGDADDDALDGGRGRDTLEGGDGSDRLRGGADGDFVRGGAGRDTLDGGAGDDFLTGGADADLLRGGTGFDTYTFFTPDGADVVADVDGSGSLELGATKLAGGDAVAPGLWRNGAATYAFAPDGDGRGELTITAGANRIVVRQFQPGTNGAAGDLGVALRNYVAPPAGSYNAIVGTAGDNNGIDGVSGHVALLGTAAADRVQGLAGRDQLLGGAGNDLLEGGSGGDIGSGGDGNDRLFADALVDTRSFADQQSGTPGNALQGDWLDGGAGDDELVGSADVDAVFGGRGGDRIFAGAGNDFVYGDGEGAATQLSWHRVDNDDATFSLLPASYTLPAAGGADFIRAGGGDDFVNADGGDDIAYGEGGNDILNGYAGSDVLYGGAGDDVLAGDESGWHGVATATGSPDVLVGGDGNDTVLGNGGDDLLFGGTGDDRIEGADGNDEIDGDAGCDVVLGGAGDDRIAGGAEGDDLSGGTGDDAIDGGDGDDWVGGEAGSDVLAGGDGDDYLSGGEGDDEVRGDAGADALLGDGGSDRLESGAGDDAADGGDGDDCISGGSGADTLGGGAGLDTVAGGDGDDVLHGDDGSDVLSGDAGADRVAGGRDDDVLAGGGGTDALWGDEGDDAIDGGGESDHLDGGVGRDTLTGGAGADVLRGEGGDDTLDGGAGGDLLLGGAGNDTYVIDVTGEPDVIVDGEGTDTYRLPDGTTLENLDFRLGADEAGGLDHLVLLRGGETLAVIVHGFADSDLRITMPDGAPLSDWALLAKLANHSKLPLPDGAFPLTPDAVPVGSLGETMQQMAIWAASPDAYVPIRLPAAQLQGSSGADHLQAAGGALTADAGAGDDEIVGGYAADTLKAGSGDDRVVGAQGADLLDGGDGDDSLAGGAGADRLDGGAGNDILEGGADEDDVAGNAGDDTLHGGDQRDRLTGGDGADALFGDDANDLLDGGPGNDLVDGGGGADVLAGGDGADTLTGGEGDDTLDGGSGDDALDGGLGDDAYLIDGRGSDRIRDGDGAATLRFAPGIVPTDFTLGRGPAASLDASTLILDFGSGNRVVLEDGLRGGFERFEFSDGTVWSRGELLERGWPGPLALAADATQRWIVGGAGADTLGVAGATGAQLDGRAGNDTLTGGDAADRLVGGTGGDTLDGRGGDDDLHGDDGDDVLSGGAGADWLGGDAGNDWLDAGAGDDRLYGGAGDDTYVIAAASGTDVIDDALGSNAIRFAPGLSRAAVTFRHDANDLVVALADGSRSWIRNGYAESRIASFTFADGTLLTGAAVRAAATALAPGERLDAVYRPPVLGTTGDDTLVGYEIVGGAGNDQLGNGVEYRFGRGDGADTISHTNGTTSGPLAVRRLSLAPGIALADVSFDRRGDDLLIAIRGTTDQVLVQGHFQVSDDLAWTGQARLHALHELRFADGTTIDLTRVNAAVMVATSGDDELDNVAAGGEGNDTLQLVGLSTEVSGGDGDDTLVADPAVYADRSVLSGGSGNDTLVAGTGYYAGTRLLGGPGDDILQGARSAILDGGPGSDRLVIGEGPDENAFAAPAGANGTISYPIEGARPQQVVLGREGGADLVTQRDSSLENDHHDAFTVRVHEDDYRNLTITRDNDDLVLGLRDRDARTTIPDFFAAGAGFAGLQGVLVENRIPGLGITAVVRSELDAAALAARARVTTSAAVEATGTPTADALAGAGGDDALVGGAGDDRLDGLSGDDVLEGGDGADLLVGRAGNDVLNGEAGDDRLVGGYGDDRLDGGGGNDRLTDAAGTNSLAGGSGDDTLRVDGGVNVLAGGDGSDLLIAYGGVNRVDGGAGNDSVTIGSGDATVDAGAGDDRIAFAGSGCARIAFGRGAGQDVVEASVAGWRADTVTAVDIGPGVGAGDLAASTAYNAGLQGYDVTLAIVGTADLLTLRGVIRDGASMVQTLRLATGEILRISDLLARPRVGTAGSDTLVGEAGDDSLSGLAGNDRLLGGAGNDRLDGGAGGDAMEGGPGSDVYIVDNPYDSVSERDANGADAGGRDQVQAAVSYMLPAWVEELQLVGGADLSAWGGGGDDTLGGNSGNNALYGQGGADRMRGGAGDDIYAVDQAGDTVVEAADEGYDRVYATASHTLAPNVEELWLTVFGEGIGNAGDNALYGSPGDDVLHGEGGIDLLAGMAGSDQLFGGDGADRLDGGAGIDHLAGGHGDDTYAVDEADDLVVEAPGEGIDRVEATSSFALGAEIEDLVLVGSSALAGTGNALANSITGGDGDDRLDGGAGDDFLAGWNGSDTYVLAPGGGTDIVDDIAYDGAVTRVAVDARWQAADVRIERDDADGRTWLVVRAVDGSAALRLRDQGSLPYPVEVRFADGTVLDTAALRTIVDELHGSDGNDVLIGRSYDERLFGLDGDDVLAGGSGDDVLDGGGGADRLDGGAGYDVLLGGSGDDTYVVVGDGDAAIELPDEGVDRIESSVSLWLNDEFEELLLTGVEPIDGTGNAVANHLIGNEASNTLDGGAGDDVLEGGGGDDVYLVDAIGDVIVELSGEGDDTAVATDSFVLPDHVENLVLDGAGWTSGTGNALANSLTGNVAPNRLDGGAGADVLAGGFGDDTYVVDSASDRIVEQPGAGTDTVESALTWVLGANLERLTLVGSAAVDATGNAAANILQGNGAGNRLDGGAGSDVMRGGAGDDTYVVDTGTDLIYETFNAGRDVVLAGVTYVLPADVESVVLTGTGAIGGTGNALANTLTGNAAGNRLDGGAGADALAGGLGNDTYVVDNAGDAITEAAGAGDDSVQSSVTHALAANVERLTLTGTAATDGTGNALANTLTGNAAGNRLDGGAGADALAGGLGNDTYVVDNACDAITEAAGGGDDSVLSSVAYVLAANVENLTLSGTLGNAATGNALGNALVGNDGANRIDGGDGNDVLWGAAGNDTLQGGNGVDLLQGGAGDDVLADALGNALLDGGAGNDAISGGAGREFYAGGAGADTLTTGGGADIIAFNRGGGADVVAASVGSDDTLSLGGGIRYADLRLRRTGLDLVLDAGAGDSITFRNWYQGGVNNRSVVNLQVVADAMASFNAAGSDRLLNKRVVTFNFAALVGSYDTALAANPALTSFDVAAAIGSYYTGGSDTAAIGGDLAYDYGHRNTLTGIGASVAGGELGAAGFGMVAQALQPAAALYAGSQRLR